MNFNTWHVVFDVLIVYWEEGTVVCTHRSSLSWLSITELSIALHCCHARNDSFSRCLRFASGISEVFPACDLREDQRQKTCEDSREELEEGQGLSLSGWHVIHFPLWLFVLKMPGTKSMSSISPFCIKIETFLRLHQIPFEVNSK